MARVTVEDCVLKVPNRFDLVMLAAQRARDVASGAPLTVERDNDKNPVVALREIAEETIELEVLADSLIKGLQRQIEVDEPEEDVPDLDLPDATEDPFEQSLDPSSIAAPEDDAIASPEEVLEEAPEPLHEEPQEASADLPDDPPVDAEDETPS